MEQYRKTDPNNGKLDCVTACNPTNSPSNEINKHKQEPLVISFEVSRDI